MSAHRPVIVRAASKFAIPLLFVFSAHLLVDGVGGPGGGFAAAGAFAAGVLLFGLLFGIDAARRAVPTLALRVGAALGVCLLLSFLLSGMEAGVFALNRLRVRRLARAGEPSAKLLHGFLD